ncbi:WHG domain-containing protein [Kineococcus sp. TBRC 1896]|uniref:WHG domain-containing protein n=1 Tax=Kineococcus mangrovi TaxID=1660183 RepID=A0ABV4I9K8_9ACTN
MSPRVVRLVVVLRSARHGVATLEAGGGSPLGADVEERSTRLVEFLDRGLR